MSRRSGRRGGGDVVPPPSSGAVSPVTPRGRPRSRHEDAAHHPNNSPTPARVPHRPRDARATTWCLASRRGKPRWSSQHGHRHGCNNVGALSDLERETARDLARLGRGQRLPPLEAAAREDRVPVTARGGERQLQRVREAPHRVLARRRHERDALRPPPRTAAPRHTAESSETPRGVSDFKRSLERKMGGRRCGRAAR